MDLILGTFDGSLCVLLTLPPPGSEWWGPVWEHPGWREQVGRSGGVNTSGAPGFREAACLCSVPHSRADQTVTGLSVIVLSLWLKPLLQTAASLLAHYQRDHKPHQSLLKSCCDLEIGNIHSVQVHTHVN